MLATPVQLGQKRRRNEETSDVDHLSKKRRIGPAVTISEQVERLEQQIVLNIDPIRIKAIESRFKRQDDLSTFPVSKKEVTIDQFKVRISIDAKRPDSETDPTLSVFVVVTSKRKPHRSSDCPFYQYNLKINQKSKRIVRKKVRNVRDVNLTGCGWNDCCTLSELTTKDECVTMTFDIIIYRPMSRLDSSVVDQIENPTNWSAQLCSRMLDDCSETSDITIVVQKSVSLSRRKAQNSGNESDEEMDDAANNSRDLDDDDDEEDDAIEDDDDGSAEKDDDEDDLDEDDEDEDDDDQEEETMSMDGRAGAGGMSSSNGGGGLDDSKTEEETMTTTTTPPRQIRRGGLGHSGSARQQARRSRRRRKRGHLIRCHKVVLCAASSVLKRMLKSSFVESERNEIVITDFSVDIVRLFVGFLYRGNQIFDNLSQSTPIAWDELFVIAEKYDVEPLCKYSLQQMMTVCQEISDKDLVLFGVRRGDGSEDDDEEDMDNGRAELEQNGIADLKMMLHTRDSNMLFRLLSFLEKYDHLGWLNEMEANVLHVIQPKLKLLFGADDLRFKALSHEALFKFMRACS